MRCLTNVLDVLQIYVDFLLKFREKAFLNWQKMSSPNWAYLKMPPIDYESIQYYSVPRTKKKLGSLEDADPELLETFEKLGISLNEQKMLANVAVDAVFDSVSIGTTFKKQLQKSGVPRRRRDIFRKPRCQVNTRRP